MQGVPSLSHRGSPATAAADASRAAEPMGRAELLERLRLVAHELGEPEVAKLAALAAEGGELERLRDLSSTRLMEAFRRSRSRACFELLYELNATPLLSQVASRLRRYQSRSDPRDVLQEVFFNVFRYPDRFDCQREDAFRVWAATIVRNTVLKHLRALGRSGRAEVPVEDLTEQPERTGREPVGGVIQRESEVECARIYLTYLHLYLRFYNMLSAREQRAIHLVEVEGVSYRDAARALGIKLENLKMVIFRARR